MRREAPDVTANKECEAFIQERLKADFAHWLRWAMFAGSIAFLALTALDFGVYPAYAAHFFAYRAAVATCLALMALFVGATRDYRAHFMLGQCAIAVSAATIEAMILQTGGHASHYATGMILLAVSTLTFLPAGFLFHSIASAVIYGIYLLPILLTERIDDAEMFFTHNFFMCSIILTVLVFRYLSMQAARKQLESEYELIGTGKRLQENRLNMMSILNNMPFLAWLKDSEGRFLVVNEPFARSCGVISPDELIGKTDLDVRPVHLAEVYRQDDAEVLNSGCKKGVEELVADRGLEKWFETYKSPLFDMAGHVVGTTGISRDITDHKNAEEKIRRISAEQQVVLDNIAGCVLYLKNRIILWANRRTTELFGYSLPEMIGQDTSILYPDRESFEETGREAYALLSEGQAYSKELQMKNRDGELIWCRIVGQAVNADRLDKGAIWLVDDITERKQTEQELSKYRMRLEEMVGERTRELETAVAGLSKEIDRRKEVEKTLERNRLLLSGVFNSIQDGIVVLDLDLHVLMSNTMLEKMFNDGKPIGFKKMRCFELYRNKERRCDNCLAFKAITTKTVQVGSITYETGDAETRWLEVSSFPFVDSQGESIGVIQYLKDITERKHAEERIIESERRYRELFDNAGEGILLLSMDGNILSTNESFARMHGYRVEEMIHMNLKDLEVRVEPQVHAERMRRILSSSRHIFEVVNRHKEGHTIDLEVSVSFVALNGEKIFLCFFRDISDRKKAEQALRESEERFRGLLDDAPVAISIVSRDGTVEYVNRKHVKLLGYDVQDVPTLEVWWTRAYPAETDRSRIRAAWRDLTALAYQGERLSPVERNVYCKDGVTRNLELRIKAAAEKIIVVFTDITERKRFEYELKVREARLIQANKMASLGLLVSGVAHEVNNPNNFIMFNSSLLQDAWPDIEAILDRHAAAGPFDLASLPYHEMKGAVPRLISGISDGASRIKGIVERLRDFACEGRSCLDGSIDVNASVKNSIMILQNQIAKHTDSFSLKLADALPIVKGSPQQIEQVIINLIMNALQSLRTRKDFVAVKTMHYEHCGQIIIEVQDYGMGMDASVLEHITEPFFTTRLGAGGTGLGLSISNSIVRDHNGTLEFLSEEGKGTTVRVHLPAMETLAPRETGYE